MAQAQTPKSLGDLKRVLAEDIKVKVAGMRVHFKTTFTYHSCQVLMVNCAFHLITFVKPLQSMAFLGASLWYAHTLTAVGVK
jgi:hypothetical protein